MIWRGIGVCAAIAVLGAAAGRITNSGDAPAARTLHAGPATLEVAGTARVAFAKSLTPPPGAAKATRLAGYAATAYGPVTVLPTTRGLLSVDCGGCVVRSLSVAGAPILVPAPGLAARLRAPAVLAALDAARVSARAHWTPGSPSRLAAAHRTAAAALDDRALDRALATAARAYDRLAVDPGARAEAVAADRQVEAAVVALAKAGAPAVQQPPSRPSAGGGVSTLTLLLIMATALLVSTLAPAAARRARRPSRTAAAEAEPASCLLAPLRRKPIAPPPTYGRWNEAPRGPGAAAAPGDGDARERFTASSSTT
jgi:hypothetical protein